MQMSLLEILQEIPDHRRREGKRFDLSTALLYAILAMVAGANSYRQMHEFIRALGLGNVHAAEFGLPIVERRLRNRVFAREVRRLRASFLLPQNPDDLLFREPFLLHRVRPAIGRTLIDAGGIFQGHVTSPIISCAPTVATTSRTTDGAPLSISELSLKDQSGIEN
jgi:hypothetical protein